MIIKWDKEIQRYCACLIFVFSLFFIISADSYTHDLWYRNDSAWFYLSGKAWMNGMIPYVDFTDSKGPLLFLIYGIGYLICPYNYIGVFWIGVFWYSAVFFMLYKLCGLFLKDDKLSLATSLSMAMAIFLPFHDTEFRAEDLCMLFIVVSFYELCKIIYSGNNSMFRWCFVTGICLGATFLIKFSITAMMLIFLVLFNQREEECITPCRLRYIWIICCILAVFCLYGLYGQLRAILERIHIKYSCYCAGKCECENLVNGNIIYFCKHRTFFCVNHGCIRMHIMLS